MAEFKASEQFNVIEATTLDGSTVTLNVDHSDSFMRDVGLPIPKTKKHTTSITDVTGAKDGAGSIAHTKWVRVLSKGEEETVRLKETPDELRKVFDQARVQMPEVNKSLGLRIREIKAAVFGR